MKTLHLTIIVGTGIGIIIVVSLIFFFMATNASQPHPMAYLKNDTGMVVLGNQVYYFETPNYTHDAYFNSPQISFHDVAFTLFPSGFRGGLPLNGCGGQYYWTNAKFSDDTSELLHIFVGFPQCSTHQPPTYFSTHTNPQAGLTFYDGKLKLLVSNGANTVISSGPDFKLGPDLLGPIPHRLTFFMNANSTAKIFVHYTSDLQNTGTTPSWASIYVGKTNYTPINSTDVIIAADPKVIPISQGSNTTVVYTITAKQVKGIYWIFLAQICGVIPISIDYPNPSPSDIPVPMGAMHCGAIFLNEKILGITGGTADYRIGEPIP